MTQIKRLPGETNEDARLRVQKEWRAAEPERKRKEEATRRKLCTGFTFWKACPHKQCRRTAACSGDVDRCFNRFWPLVPERDKVFFRAFVTASAGDKLPHHEAVRHARAEVARYLKMEARFAAQKVKAAEAIKPLETTRFVPENKARRVRSW